MTHTQKSPEQQLYLGIMSGTSVDGIDVALININSEADKCKTEFLLGEEFEFEQDLRTKILSLCQTQMTSLQALGELTTQLSLAYADAVNLFIIKNQLNAKHIIAVGCHGQTVFHQPTGQYPFSMQLVNASVITANTGITTVTDFRSMDIALAGQGAPLVPIFHQDLLTLKDDRAQVFLNIGGIANISIVNPKPLSGFDTGPGNVLLDLWIAKIQGCRYDENGAFAASGQCNEALLSCLLSEKYFTLPPPKSSGRELFNLDWLQQKLSEFTQPIGDADIMATLVQLTCKPIVDAIEHFAPGQLLVCGGGAKNGGIMQALQQALPQWQVCSTDEVGISGDFIEAMAFAWLAYRCMNGLPGNDPQVTGATRSEICGSVTRVLTSQ
ncbi:anhydro-N-acetylmuramic acid kinase [Colwellia piezophila]|uniref:anhydro-N-acetylmuramic acid kinase n=1 Tax=Colwellia piezophila TaxID=211668 RepID=UPI000363FBCE|nr:anhydro-N-acetylmuramic acid kinase [Colwellia piezophila]